MKKILIGSLLLLSACSNDIHLLDNREPEIEVKEGLYTFKEVDSNTLSGTLELQFNHEGKVDLIQTQIFITENENNSYGTLPTLSRSNLISNGNIVAQYAVNLNYTNYNDIEKDGGSSDLTGLKYTRVILTQDTDGRLLLTVMIHEGATNSNGGINKVVVTRIFKEISE